MTRLTDWWASGTLVDCNEHRIFTRVEGQGRTIVFLHGFPTSSHDWSDVIADMARDYRCVTFDYLGYGASDKPAGADYSSILQTDRVLQILTTLDVREAIFVGHDLGGIILQQIISRVADGSADIKISDAIFTNSSIYAQLYRPTHTQQMLIDPQQGPELARRISRETLAKSFRDLCPKRPLSSQEIDDVWQAISREDGQLLWPRHLVYMRERYERCASWIAAMHRSAIPIALLYGAEDNISGQQIIEEAKSDLPRARCVSLPGLGHYPHVEDASTYTKALRALIDRQSEA